MDAADPLFLVLLFFLHLRDDKHFLLPLDPENDTEDLVLAVVSDDNDDNGETREVKELLMISSM